MSPSVAFTLAFILIFGTPVQERLSVNTPDSVSVLKASWQKHTFRPGWDDPLNPASNGAGQDMRTNMPRDPTVVNTTANSQPLPTSSRVFERREQLSREQRESARSTGTESSDPATAPTRPVDQYVYEIKVLNSSGKPIEAIDWEYSIAESENTPGPRFHTFRRIKPASAATLTGKSSAPPARVVNARSSQVATLPSRVIIRCVLYSDGTVSWRAAAQERDCDGLKNPAKRR